MSVAQFPTTDAGGRWISRLQDLPIEYAGVVIRTFKDGGSSFGAETTNGVLRWDLFYDGLTPTEAGVFDTHMQTAFFNLLPFSFKHPRTGTTYTDCHYETFEYPAHAVQNGYHSQQRHIVLVKRPA